MTQAIIMAAGLGSRLKDLTVATPKALIEVGGRPLIDYALAFAARAGATRRIVVTGYCHADVASRVARVDPSAIIVENAEYKLGNLISMLRGHGVLQPGAFLLMNTDHVYKPAIADLVADACARATEITAFCDFDRQLGADDMKVGLDGNRRVEKMAKTLDAWDCGYVGMTFVPANRRDAYKVAAADARATHGDAAHVETMLVRLAVAGTPPVIADISGHGWLEVDEPHERAHADQVLATGRWWPEVQSASELPRRHEPILLTPGPVRVPPLVSEYLARPPCNYHRQDAFCELFADNQRDLMKLVGIVNPAAYFATILTTTGTGANEACLLALEGLGKGLIVSNGFFGDRVIDQARQNQLAHTELRSPHDLPLDPAAIGRALDAEPALRWVFFVSHETRAGLKNPFEEIGKLCKQRGRFVAADAISSAFAYPIDLEASQVDLVTASSAKAIMAAPGLGIVFTRRDSVSAIKAAGRPRGYYLDVIAEYEKQAAERQPRFAQPVVLHAALRAACIHLSRDGIATHFARIQRQMSEVIEHLATLGVTPMLDARYRSNIAVNFRLRSGLGYRDFAARMERLGYYCLYGIPGDQTHFQVSTIGHLTDEELPAVKSALTQALG